MKNQLRLNDKFALLGGIMDSEWVKPGSLMEYKDATVEIVDVNVVLNIAFVRRQQDHVEFTVRCDDLVDDLQSHSQCEGYY